MNSSDIRASDPHELLKWNRLITAFDIFYLNNKRNNCKLAQQVYFERVRSSTFNTFTEFDNLDKNSYNAYCDEFDKIFDSISQHGFDKGRSLLPIANNGSILNGSHRLAASIISNEKVYFFKSEQDFIVDDYEVLLQRNVPANIVELAVCEFIKYSNNVYLAFLWPSSRIYYNSIIEIFDNVLYRKKLKLSSNGAFNLLTELYKHMDWSGNEQNSYQGIKQKLVECFPSFEQFTVIAFQADSIEHVRLIKERIRNICGIGYSSIHITDTSEEARRVSQLLFNNNGVHFLNYSKPNAYRSVHEKLNRFRQFIANHAGYDLNDFVVDGSTILSLYGLRESDDLDFLYSKSGDLRVSEFHSHDECLAFHKISKEDLIYDPNFYFSYLGIKFVSFDQTYKFKKERNEEKDKTDCALMDAYMKNNNFRLAVFRIKQIFFYRKIILKRKAIYSSFFVLKKVGLYNATRSIYRYLKS